ncbi:putative phage abortive infection protein [Lelliottia amnigena]|uniref:putative phage abortive infection protein n=1 Tax=Lelliottia amnigena TaxID=61646 RepID=UPI0021D9C73C|nr:putative phage abortive infection protein [Lelliottia amnigena]MCU7782279.1 putative phage abortive infection protein [Lelliottia amnigena]
MFIFLMFIIVMLGASYGYVILNGIWPFDSMELTQTGLFGDSWGAFTSIFSALGFCGVLWTIKLQRDATRQIELDAKKRENSEKLRDFENSFFNMLNILQTIIKDMRVGGDDKKIKKEGRQVFTHYYSRFKNETLKKYKMDLIAYLDNLTFSLEKEKSTLSKSFEFYFRGRSGNFSHYFRYVYNMFKFIDCADIDDEDKKKYAKILRSQISNYELLILFYNGNGPHGEKFKHYINEYSLFDNLPIDKLISDVHVAFFEVESWGENEDALKKLREIENKKLI